MLDKVDEEDLEDWGVDVEQLEGRDFVVTLDFRTETDVIASALCVAFFCNSCDGITFDDDGELSINSSNSTKWLQNYI